MNLRLKLRKNQSTIPTEKLTEEIQSLEILGDSVERLPSLSHLKNCRYLLLVCPQLSELPTLPQGLEILKIKGGHFGIESPLPTGLKTLSIHGLKDNNRTLSSLSFPTTLETLDLANNALEELPASLFNITTLQRLSLDHNALKDLPQELFSMKSLNHLSLDNNSLTELDKQSLYDAFGIWF